MASSSDFTKITVGVGLEEGLDIRKANTYLKQFQDVIKNLTDEGLAFSSALRKTTDKITQDVYVPTKQLPNVRKAFDSVKQSAIRMPTDLLSNEPYSDPLSYSEGGEVEMLKMQKKILGNRRVIAKYAAEIKRHGGSMEAGIKENYYDITVPNVDLDSGTGKSSFARKLNKDIARENSDVRAKEAAVQQAKDDKEFDAKDAYGRKIAAKRMEAQLKKEEKEDKKKEKDEEKTGKRSGLDALKSIATMAIVVKVLKELLDVAKKIFTALIASTSEALNQTLMGMRYSMSPVDVMRYGTGETAKGLTKGTFAGAVGAAQNKFGNITQLDTKSIELLAVVMGENIRTLIESGLGGENPTALVDTIIKGFMDQAMAGKNSIGMSVGVEAAIRELMSYLGKVDPNMAALFNRQMYDRLSSASSATTRDSARGSTSAWLLGSSAVTNPLSQTALDRGILSDLAPLVSEIKALVEALTSGWMAKFFLEFSGLIDPMRNFLRGFMSDEAKEADVLAARRDNADLSNRLTESRVGTQQRYTALATKLRSGNERYTKKPELLEGDLDDIGAGILPPSLLGIDSETLQDYVKLLAVKKEMAETDRLISNIAKQAIKDDTKRVTGSPEGVIQEGASFAKGAVSRLLSQKGISAAADDSLYYKYGTYKDRAKYRESVGALAAGETEFSASAAISRTLSSDAAEAVARMIAARLITAEASEGKNAGTPTEIRVVGGESLLTVQILDKEGTVLKEKTINNILGIEGESKFPTASGQQKPVSQSSAYKMQVQASTGGKGQ
jgi:hypothetical protein